MKLVKLSEVKLNPNNPRLIKDDKFTKLVQSIKDFPEMLDIRPIVVNQDMVILGGNMRFKACKEAGLKQVPIIITDLTEEQQREFLIKDNTSGGEWDWEVLKNEWNLDLTNMDKDLPKSIQGLLGIPKPQPQQQVQVPKNNNTKYKILLIVALVIILILSGLIYLMSQK